MVPLIVGAGLQTSLGTSLDSTWRSLIEGRFIADHARVPTKPAPGRSRIAAIATAAALESLAHAGIDSLQGTDTALVVGTSKGPIEQWLTPELPGGSFAAVVPSVEGAAPRTTVPDAGRAQIEPDRLAGLAELAAQLSRNLGLSGPRLTLSAACASGLHALIRGTLLIRSGEMKRVLVVAAECSLHALFVGNFQRLGVLSPPGFGCRPFDRDRRGFVMSEAAAAVILEAPDFRPRRTVPDRPIAVERFAFAADATHLTGNDPEAKALRRILASVIDARPIDLAHAHGTGTEANDAVELPALDATLSPSGRRPTLYSHKAALGHSLGASGLVSVVLNCMSHRTGIIPGNVQTLHPLDSARLDIRRQTTERRVDRSLAIAAGFGGAIAAVGLRSHGGTS